MKPQRFTLPQGVAVRRMPEWAAYGNAKKRCRNRNNPGNGGRGIKFKFKSFAQFYAEIGPRPPGMTLDRKNNDGHYEPGNVRWATPKQQQANTRPKTWTAEALKRLREAGRINGCISAHQGGHHRKRVNPRCPLCSESRAA